MKQRNHHPPEATDMPLKAGRFSHGNLWVEHGGTRSEFSRPAPPRLESPDWACLHGDLAKPVRCESGGKTVRPMKYILPSALRSSHVTRHVPSQGGAFLVSWLKVTTLRIKKCFFSLYTSSELNSVAVCLFAEQSHVACVVGRT